MDRCGPRNGAGRRPRRRPSWGHVRAGPDRDAAQPARLLPGRQLRALQEVDLVAGGERRALGHRHRCPRAGPVRHVSDAAPPGRAARRCSSSPPTSTRRAAWRATGSAGSRPRSSARRPGAGGPAGRSCRSSMPVTSIPRAALPRAGGRHEQGQGRRRVRGVADLREPAVQQRQPVLPDAAGLLLPVDHIYAEPGVGIRAWSQVLQLADGMFRGVIPSDHNPVLADLTIRS